MTQAQTVKEGLEMLDPVRDGELVREAQIEQPIVFRGPTYQACYLVSFHTLDGGAVGWLDWKDGKLTFGGDLDESARVFFELLKTLIEEYHKARD